MGAVGGHAAASVCNAQGGGQLSEAHQIEAPVAAVETAAIARPRLFSGLRGRLLLLTAAFVLFAELLIYRDEHHLTASYARSLAPELGRQIGVITGWW